jgi:hypothetical protein
MAGFGVGLAMVVVGSGVAVALRSETPGGALDEKNTPFSQSHPPLRRNPEIAILFSGYFCPAESRACVFR